MALVDGVMMMEYSVQVPTTGWPGCIGMTHIVYSLEEAVEIAEKNRPSCIRDKSGKIVGRYD